MGPFCTSLYMDNTDVKRRSRSSGAIPTAYPSEKSNLRFSISEAITTTASATGQPYHLIANLPESENSIVFFKNLFLF